MKREKAEGDWILEEQRQKCVMLLFRWCLEVLKTIKTSPDCSQMSTLLKLWKLCIDIIGHFRAGHFYSDRQGKQM